MKTPRRSPLTFLALTLLLPGALALATPAKAQWGYWGPGYGGYGGYGSYGYGGEGCGNLNCEGDGWDGGYADMKEMVRMKAHLVERNRALMEKNLALYEVIDRLRHDPDYVAYVARKELGLVGQEDIGLVHEGPADGHTLLLPARELLGVLVGQAIQAQEGQDLFGPLP